MWQVERVSKGNLTLRRAQDSDWPAIATADARAFAFVNPLDEEALADIRTKVLNDDVIVVHDMSDPERPALVGVSMFFRMTMTVPGGERVSLPGLSWVSVASTHRRRGILRMMISELFEQWERESSVFSILTASEGTIYERFGYGPAAFEHSVRVDLRRAELRAPAPADSRVRYADADQIRDRVPQLHDRWVSTRPGAIVRAPEWWTLIFADRSILRDGRSGLHYLLHPDGYASYRIHHESEDASVAEVSELFAVTDEAHSDLWRVLVGLDLLPAITATTPVDDPLPLKLTDLRAPSVTGIRDSMWLRILDVPAALSLREYGLDAKFVLEISDKFRSAGGRFRVTISGGRAQVVETDDEPTVTMDISVLGSLYLGAYRAVDFAAAERLWAVDGPTLHALDQALSTDRKPVAGTFF
jgi:predicted acetyltransferase